MEFSPSRQKRMAHEGFAYRFDRALREGTEGWRCTSNCPGRIHVSNGLVLRIVTAHNHAPKRARADVQPAMSPVQTSRDTPNSVIKATQATLSQDTISSTPQPRTMERTIERKRKLPRIPSPDPFCSQEIDIPEDLKPFHSAELLLDCYADDEPQSEWDSAMAEPAAAAAAPDIAQTAVLMPSGELPVEPIEVKGYDFNDGIEYSRVLKSFATTGFQATNFARAVAEINRMIDMKLKPVDSEDCEIDLCPIDRPKSNCTIFLGYTSNIVSSGVREVVRFLAQHNMVDCIVTTAGGVEEDFIKCLAPTYVGDFHLSGRDLRDRGINRIGNLLAPNDNYCKFEDWLMPILDAMVAEQKEQNIVWTPSKLIARLGREIDNPDSIYFWCYKNNIPVYSPALTDGSIGDMIYFHSYKNPGLVLDIVEDLRRINSQAVYAANSGVIILGGGLVKHHICNANLMRNGTDFCVYVNTAQEFDGSDSGARPDEAISWGKIKKSANPVKVYGEASMIFPLLVGETFARKLKAFKK